LGAHLFTVAPDAYNGTRQAAVGQKGSSKLQVRDVDQH